MVSTFPNNSWEGLYAPTNGLRGLKQSGRKAPPTFPTISVVT